MDMRSSSLSHFLIKSKSMQTSLLTSFFILLFSMTCFGSYSVPEFELVVIESLPEDISLDMSIGQLENAKQNSRVHKNKQLIYEILT